MKVLVYGGTGSQARPLVLQLLARGRQPYVLTRSPSGATDLRKAGAHLVGGDLEDAPSIEAANRGMDAVALLIPAFVSDPSKAAAYAATAMNAAAHAGVKLVVWNTGGRLPESNDSPEEDCLTLRIWAVLKQWELPLIVIAPTTYMENLLGPWMANSIRTFKRVAYPVLANRRMGWIAARDVGALIAAALERPSLMGRVFRVSGIEALTGRELAAAFSDVLRHGITYAVMSPLEMEAALDEAFGPGSGASVAAQYGCDQRNPAAPEKWHDMDPVLRELPVPMTTIREWISQNRSAFV